MATWADVVALAAALPEVSESTSYGRPCLRVRKQPFLRHREDERLVVWVVDEEDKQALLRSDPAVFSTTPHYDGYAMVLVDLDAVGDEQLRELVEDAWRLRAPKRLVAAYDAG